MILSSSKSLTFKCKSNIRSSSGLINSQNLCCCLWALVVAITLMMRKRERYRVSGERDYDQWSNEGIRKQWIQWKQFHRTRLRRKVFAAKCFVNEQSESSSRFSCRCNWDTERKKKRFLPKREDTCQEEVKMSCKETCKHLPLAFIINRDEDIKEYLGIDGSTFH